jgi:alcohol dehydrogenase
MNTLLLPIEIVRPEAIEFGPGALAMVGRWAEEKGIRRVLVVADAFNAARVEVLGLPGDVTVFGEVKPEPDISQFGPSGRARRALAAGPRGRLRRR